MAEPIPARKGNSLKRTVFALTFGVALGLFAGGLPAAASHSWGNYHWARTANPFTLKLGDNVTSAWDPYLAEARNDWNPSTVLDLTIVAGGAGNVKTCKTTAGRVEVCNAKYGNNGWLGIAGISVSGGHITAAYVKLNDTYFTQATYNKPEWRRLVMCQEVAHAFGLDHQDENFNNGNLGTCMDYTNNPLGPPSNEHPNRHDFDQIEAIYSHLDSTTTVGASVPGPGKKGSSNVRHDQVDAFGNGTVTWTFYVPN